MKFDSNEMERKVKELSKDLEKGEFTTTTWIWIICGGFLGLAASCLKFTQKNIKPILARMTKVGSKMEEK